MEYQTSDRIVYKSWKYNRKHSLDRVMLNESNRKNDTDIENVKIVYGPGSDEYTRNRHALALTIANAIYFRGGKYRPETEEGRALLAHELTHVAQYAEKRMLRQTDRKELEAEAKEVQQEYNPDPEIVIKIKGKYERIRKSKLKRKKRNWII